MNITHNPPFLFLTKNSKKKMMGNIAENLLNDGSNAFKFYQI
jgi:hypothetical protein